MLRLIYGPRAAEQAATLSWLRYEEVAVPRVVRIFRELGIKQTFFFPGYCIDRYPNLVEGVLLDGHEVGLHGYLHEVSFNQDAAGELAILERGLEAASKLMPDPPVGWRAPLFGLSDRSPELLVEHGFLYDASLMGDDQPYVLSTPKGELVEVPSEWANDDWPHYAHVPALEYVMQVKAPRLAAEVWRAEFDAAYRHGGCWVTALHPSVSGRLARLEVVVAMLEEMLSRGDVWVAPLSEIAGHVRRLADAGEWKPRIVEVERTDGATTAQRKELE